MVTLWQPLKNKNQLRTWSAWILKNYPKILETVQPDLENSRLLYADFYCIRNAKNDNSQPSLWQHFLKLQNCKRFSCHKDKSDIAFMNKIINNNPAIQLIECLPGYFF